MKLVRMGMASALALMLLAAGWAAAQQTPEPVTLRLKFQPNQVIRYRVFARVEGQMETQLPQAQGAGMPGSIPIQATVTANLTTKTLGVDTAGAGRISMRLDDLVMAMQMMGQQMKMALQGGKLTMTANGQPTQSIPLVGMPGLPQGQKLPLIQEPITVKFDPRGRIMDVTVPGMPPMPGMDMATLMRQSQFTLPEQPVAIGGTWTDHQEVPFGTTPLVVDASYTLEKVETLNGMRMASIRVALNSRVDNASLADMMGAARAAGQPVPAGMQGTMSMAVTLNGVLLFNASAGRVSRFDFEAGEQMAMNAAMPGPDGQQVNVATNMNITAKGAVAAR